MKQLLVYTLTRMGRPATAAEVTDTAIAIALDAGWQRKHVPNSVHKVSAELRGMLNEGLILEGKPTREEGKDRPTYLSRFPIDAAMELTEPETETPKGHPVESMEPHQLIALFDTFQMALEMRERHKVEMDEVLQENRRRMDVVSERHAREADRMSSRIRTRSEAAGLKEFVA